MILQVIVARSGDDIQLLLTRQIDELHGITGYADRKVRVFLFFRMFHCIDQFLCAKYVYIQVMGILCKISVQNLNQVILALLILMSKCIRITSSYMFLLPALPYGFHRKA